MYAYYNRIIETLIANPELSRYDLYQKCGAGDKRKFLKEIERLLKEGEIIGEFNSSGYCPKKHWLDVFLKAGNIFLEKVRINFVPSKVLEKEMEYINPGTDDEGDFEFQLQIAGGYRIEEKHKAFLELNNNISLKLDKYTYSLNADFYNKLPDSDARTIHILYVDNNQSFAFDIIKKIKKNGLRNSTWTVLSDSAQAIYFLESKFELNEQIDLIITEDNAVIDGNEFIEAVRGLETEVSKKFTPSFNTPVIALTQDKVNMNFERFSNTGNEIFLHFTKSEDPYVISCVIKNLVADNSIF